MINVDGENKVNAHADLFVSAGGILLMEVDRDNHQITFANKCTNWSKTLPLTNNFKNK